MIIIYLVIFLKKNILILLVATIITRILGFIFLIPFARLVGTKGTSLYSYAYIPYCLFLDISSFGIPIGISKIIITNDKNKQKDIIIKSFKIILIISIILFIVFNLLSKRYSNIVLANKNLDNKIEDVTKVVRIISLTLLITPLIAVIRGYHQGNHNVKITSITFILEQVIRLLLMLLGSYIIIKILKLDYTKAIYFSVFSSFISNLIVLIYSLFTLKFEGNNKINNKKLLKDLFKYTLPFSIYGITFSLFQLIDSLYFNKGLIEYGINNPEYYYGIYSFEIQRIINLPVSIILSIQIAIMPSISEDYENKNYKLIKFKIIKIYKLIFIFLLPLIFINILYSEDIYNLFYHQNKGDILRDSSILILLYTLTIILSNIMLGINLEEKLLILIIIINILKIFITKHLINNYGIKGIINSNIIPLLIFIILSTYYVFSKIDISLNITNIIIKILLLNVSIIFLLSILNNYYKIKYYYNIFMYIILIISFYIKTKLLKVNNLI